MYCRHCIESSSSEEETENETPIRPLTTKPIELDAIPDDAFTQSIEEDSIHQPLLETQKESSDILDNKAELKVSTFTVIKSLLWLHNKLTFNTWKRFILPVVLGLLLLLVIRIVSLLQLPAYQCEDGSYAPLAMYCIDNDNPPKWNPSFDAYFFESSHNDYPLPVGGKPHSYVSYSKETPYSILVDDCIKFWIE